MYEITYKIIDNVDITFKIFIKKQIKFIIDEKFKLANII